MRQSKKDNIQSVTSLPISPEEEQKQRFRTYVIAMLVRTISIPLIFIIPAPWFVLPILLAIFIPAIAVVIANQQGSPTGVYAESPKKELK